MRRYFTNWMIILFCMILSVLPGCETEVPEQILPDATVTIVRTSDLDKTSFKVVFEPSENAVAYEYAIGTSSDESAFVNGALGNVRVEGNEAKEVLFDKLAPGTYTVYARAFNNAGKSGSLASMTISTMKEADYNVSLYFMTDNSVSVKFEYTAEYTNFRYYLGKESDKEAFLNGELVDNTLKDIFGYYYISYFGIERDKYMFFAQGEDLAGNKTDLFEIPVDMPAYEDIPNAEFKVNSQDIFRGQYTLVPNDKCGKISAVVNTKSYFDSIIYGPANWMGDHITTLALWESLPMMNGSYAVGKNLDIKFDDVLFSSGEVELIVLFWDKDLNPVGVKRYEVSKPEYDSSLPQAKVSISVSDITTAGATYTYEPDENTLGFLYDTVDADWYDEFCNSAEWTETYIHELLFEQGYYWSYSGDVTDGKVIYQETTGEPGKRYYAVACPMNANGPGLGWGEMTMIEYTTKTE